MKWTKLKTMVASSLVFGLTTQSLLSYGLTVNLPQKLVNVKFPTEYQQKIDEIAVCVLEAEQVIYDAKTLKTLPKLKTSETRSCHDILKTKPYADNITFQVDYSKSHADIEEDGGLIMIGSEKQSPLTILSEPLQLKENPYYKDTETLEIAMRMFQDLNIGLYGELAELHQENDILDMLYLRIFNLVYELPKAQGHPLMTEFMKDIRDNFFRVSSSQFFRALIWYADENNPDKELSRTLKLYLYQLEYAGIDPGSEIPDENLKLPGESNIVDKTPGLTDFEETSREDFSNLWNNAYEEAIAEEDKEDLGNHYEAAIPSVERETLKTYEVKNGVCMRITTTTENGKEIDRFSEKAPSGEVYRCGDSSLLGNEPTLSDSEEVVDALNPIVSYRYGGDEAEWVHTTLKAKEGALSYSYLSDLLMTIASEFGAGSLQESNRWLYILSGKPLYLEKYKEDWSIQEINKWLASKEIELEFGLNVEDQEAQQNFFDWLHSKEK